MSVHPRLLDPPTARVHAAHAGPVPDARCVPLDNPSPILLETEPARPRFVAELRDPPAAETPPRRR